LILVYITQKLHTQFPVDHPELFPKVELC
jgi:hypothetical protein